MTLREMNKQAYILASHPDVERLKEEQEGFWDRIMDDLLFASALDGLHLAAGEGNLICETRRPAGQTADYAQVTQTTTSKNWLPQDGTAFMYPKNYWDLGKEWRFSMFGKMTTGATPGNHTTEIRQQAAQPITDAGGSILATTTAVAAGASKTNISWVIIGHVQGRAAVGTAAAMFAWALFISNQLSVLLPAANIPQLIPESAAASVNIDTTAAGGVSLQGKNSGANASTVTVHDLNVQAIS
jgi:hypothetical protein